MHDFFNRLKRVYDRDAMDKIDSVYHIIKYAEKYSEEDTEKLKDLLKTVSIKMK
jgi:predicted membrane protein